MVTSNWKSRVLLVLALVTLACLIMAGLVSRAAGQSTQYGCLYISEIAWAGTEASTADEWYEVGNLCDTVVDIGQDGWFIEVVREDGTVLTSTMPADVIRPIGQNPNLYERTDDSTVSNVPADGIHGSGGTGGSLVGIFPNSGLTSFGIVSGDRSEYHFIEMPDGVWPAGTSQPKASMQVEVDNGVFTWYTSNHFTGAYDAHGNEILGTPGGINLPNVGDPNTCDVLPGSWDWDLDVVLFEDFSSRGEIYLEADLWGVAADGTLIQTEGQVIFAHFAQPNMYGQTGWLPIDTAWEEETSSACIDALEMLRDGTENVLRGLPSGVADESDLWPVYADWLNAVLEFQRSNLFITSLPIVVNGE